MPVGVVATVEGTATVIRASGTSSPPLHVKDSIFVGDRIQTDARSRARLLLGGAALLTLTERSVVTIGQSMIELASGTIVLAAMQARLKVGEVVEIRTPDAVAQIRGTVVVAEVSADAGADAGAPDGMATRFTVLNGVVDVIPLDAAQPSTAVLKLGSLQTLVIGKRAPSTQPRTLTVEDARALRSVLGMTGASTLTSAPVPPPITAPADWTLLVDRGQGFDLWWGAAPDGDVAGDEPLAGTTLATCDAVARTLAQEGARAACARLLWIDSRRPARHRDTDDHLIARGPLAGKLAVYEPGTDAAGWRLICGLGGRWRLDQPALLSIVPLELSTCYAASMRLLERGERTACVRSLRAGGSTSPEYRDARGRLMVEGPLAGDFVVHDPAPPPTSP